MKVISSGEECWVGVRVAVLEIIVFHVVVTILVYIPTFLFYHTYYFFAGEQ